MVGVLAKTLAFALVGQILPALMFVPLKTEKYYDLCSSLGFLTTTAFSLYQSTDGPSSLFSMRSGGGENKAFSLLERVKDLLSSRLTTSSAAVAAAATKTHSSSGLLLWGRHPRQLIGSACVVLWAVRLGSFLFMRIRQSGHDPRFNEIKRNPAKFTFAWLMQGVWVALTALPVYMLNALAPHRHPALDWLDALALFVWASGLTLEVIADRTKSTWRQERDAGKHHDKFLHRGVWQWCRHPNYFGEITLWSGLALLSLFTLLRTTTTSTSTSTSNNVHSSTLSILLLPLLSPAFEYGLIRYLSGVPMLEEKMNAKLGDDPAYKAFKARVPCFVPFIGSTT